VEKSRARGSYSPGRRDPRGHHLSIIQSIEGTRGARIINVSFTGPRDPSIERRTAQARQQE
jgi:hypothetical protein